MRYEVFVPLILAHLSESAIAADRHADAVSLMAQLASRDPNKEHWCTAEVLRVKGLLALSGDDDPDAAATLFLQSAALARKQGALAWELRAAMNLARLRANQGRQREAIELLEAVYNKLTEGFETVDVLAARSLLRELAHQNS
jgi:predicted ATPase